MRSANVDGRRVFSSILQDLSDPGRALGGRPRAKYRIYSITTPAVCFNAGEDPEEINPADFLVKSELYGVPQARHRVILVGVRHDVSRRPALLVPSDAGVVSVDEVIGKLPAICASNARVPGLGTALHEELLFADSRGLGDSIDGQCWSAMHRTVQRFARSRALQAGAAFVPFGSDSFGDAMPMELRVWLRSSRLDGVVDHVARPHMAADLLRYLFCAVYAQLQGRSPTSKDFPESLAPKHRSWKTGAFADRFRVQLAHRPATTITSHISRDGHYFIHPDPNQIRSLSVREAARLQTFPDDYYFAGARTAKYLQIGNAVPPYLAQQIAASVCHLIN